MVDVKLRRLVRQRAEEQCEYCHLPQNAVDLKFHIEHIVPRQHRGPDDPDNLALACDRCNLNKGSNLTAIDPVTQKVTVLFNPRRDLWQEHFELVGVEVLGKTPVGRATAELLRMNHSRRRELRERLLTEARTRPS